MNEVNLLNKFMSKRELIQVYILRNQFVWVVNLINIYNICVYYANERVCNRTVYRNCPFKVNHINMDIMIFTIRKHVANT